MQQTTPVFGDYLLHFFFNHLNSICEMTENKNESSNIKKAKCH